jgi:hypothetical protein
MMALQNIVSQIGEDEKLAVEIRKYCNSLINRNVCATVIDEMNGNDIFRTIEIDGEIRYHYCRSLVYDEVHTDQARNMLDTIRNLTVDGDVFSQECSYYVNFDILNMHVTISSTLFHDLNETTGVIEGWPIDGGEDATEGIGSFDCNSSEFIWFSDALCADNQKKALWIIISYIIYNVYPN